MDQGKKGIMMTRDNTDQTADQNNNNGDTEDEEYGGESSSAEKGNAESTAKKKGTSAAGIRTARGAGGVATAACCQAERCGADLSEAKRYHRRHKVCEPHSKAPVVPVAGLRQRFCQQCSRFHELSEFDEAKRSCRRRLAGHNERRRKSSVECYGEGSAAKITSNSKETTHYNGDANIDPRPKFQPTLPGNSQYNNKHYLH